MFPENCKAELKTMDNHLLEIGSASLSIKDKFVDFKSSFVPLFKISSLAKIICIENGISTHIITGKVYLSSPTLLRLVSIKCSLLPGAESVLNAHTKINSKILIPAVKSGFFSNRITHKWDDCTVISISLQQIILRANRIMFEYEDNIRIKIGEPIFSKISDISLKIGQKGLMFGKNSKYYYNIISLNEREKAELSQYIRNKNIEFISFLN